MKSALPGLAKSDDPAAAELIAAVAKDNPDRTSRGLAHLFLGISQKRQAAEAPESRQKAHLAAAEKALAAAAADYADVKLGPGETDREDGRRPARRAEEPAEPGGRQAGPGHRRGRTWTASR